MRLTFLVSLLGIALLFITLWKVELTAKNASMKLKRLRRRLEAAEHAAPSAPASPELVGAP